MRVCDARLGCGVLLRWDFRFWGLVQLRLLFNKRLRVSHIGVQSSEW